VARDEGIANTATEPANLLSPRFASDNVASRLDRIFKRPVAPLNAWVARLREDARLPPRAGSTIPWFDPRGGGTEAKVLLLQQDPSQVATFTNFCSPDNNDPTAKNATVACREAGLAMSHRVHWNVFPWWVNIKKRRRLVDPTRPWQTFAGARALGATLFLDLLDLLPDLRVVVLLGREAGKAFDGINGVLDAPQRSLVILRCGSFSPQSWNNTDPEDPRRRRRSETIIERLVQARVQAGL